MKKILLLLLCTWTSTLMAQSNNPKEERFHFGVAYLNNGVINPGLQLDADWVIKVFTKTKNKTHPKLGKYTIQRKRQLALETRLGFYWDPLANVTLFNQYLLCYRWLYQKPGEEHKDWNLSLGIGPGYHHVLLPETYEVDEQGQVSELGLAARAYPSAILDFRFIRSRKSKRLNAWFIGFNTLSIFNYNATAVSTNSMYFGFRLKLKAS